MIKKDINTRPDLLSDLTEFEQSQIAVTSGKTPEQVILFLTQNKVKHLIQKDSEYFQDRMNSSLKIVQDPKVYFNSPIKTILNAKRVSIHDENELVEFEYRFNSSTQKVELLNRFETYFQTFGQSSSLLNDINLVIDELFTNSIYNAPSNDLENTASGASRDGHGFELPPGMFARIFAGRQDDCLLIGCEDPFGTLNVKRMIERIHSCFTMGVDKVMQFGEGGAGIGCYLIFLNSMRLYIGVEKEMRTMICSVFPLGMGDRKRSEISKDFHYIEA